MKKFLPLLLVLISSILIFSCKDDDEEVVVDYPTVYDIPANLQFFFSTDGFSRGYYPLVSTLIGETSTKLTINFADYPNLFVDPTEFLKSYEAALS